MNTEHDPRHLSFDPVDEPPLEKRTVDDSRYRGGAGARWFLAGAMTAAVVVGGLWAGGVLAPSDNWPNVSDTAQSDGVDTTVNTSSTY